MLSIGCGKASASFHSILHTRNETNEMVKVHEMTNDGEYGTI
jgi:hypothetical protein